MQNEYRGNIPPGTPGAEPRETAADLPPKKPYINNNRDVPRTAHTRAYWAVGALVVVIVAIFAMTARQPGVPMPEEQNAPSGMPMTAPASPPAGTSDATPATPMDPPMTTPASPGTPPAAGGPAGGTP